MAEAPPPPRTGRQGVVVLLLATTVVIGGMLLMPRRAPQPAPVGNSTAPASQAAASFAGPAPVAGVTRDFMIGSWATESCTPPAAVYAADGTTDGGRRRWALDGDRLIVSRGAEREESVVERLGDDRIRLNTSAGPFELRRCPAAR